MSSVRVAVRARPFSERELASSSHFCLEMKGKKTILYNCGEVHTGRGSAKEFHFDHSYWSVGKDNAHCVGQEQVYSDLGGPVIKAAFAGYNSCVFAYGQTGSGKTYTMTGSATEPGLIPRICKELFSQIEGSGSGGDSAVSYRTELSYLEIYNEKVRDLLAGGKAGPALRIREHPREGPYVEGLSQHAVHDYTGVACLLTAGNSLRATASTKMNDSSSRSHAIFTLTMTQAVLECGVPSETRSKLHLVDLAGSERASATGAEGVRLKEGSSINKSLVCLGTVISALADKAAHHGKKTLYVPYRDSVLTYLLKDSLGGNAKTIMIATYSSYGETLSTLRYASRARAIINKPVVNEDSSVKVIRELKSEVERLKAIITTQHLSMEVVAGENMSKTTGSLVADIHKKEEKVAELTKEWASKWKDIQQIMKVVYSEPFCVYDQKAHDLALHCNGAKLVVHSDHPHLVGVDPDILSTGLVFLYLKGECTIMGSQSAKPPPDIAVPGADIADLHCRLVVQRGKVVLHPLNGECFINRVLVTTPGRLRQGDLLQLGSSAVFRFNHPQEAKRLRKRHSEGLLGANRLARHRRARTRSTPHTLSSPPPSPTTASPATSVVELHSEAVLRACDPTSPPATSLTFSQVQRSQKSHLALPLELGRSFEEWNSLSLAKIAMSPLTILRTLVTPYSDTLPQHHHSDENIEPGRVSSPPSCWWRRLLCAVLLLCNAPWLLGVFGTLTVPAVSMLAMLVSSIKLCAVLQKCWLSRWLATVLALLTTALVTPVVGLCSITVGAGLSSLSALHLIPPIPQQRTRKPV
ncbi:Kinesin-like protein Klp98A [Geodia barretti]|uniref:Kinesin-like protein n=1 Tax=Geodia barretti TaxID=519541 RepID=A0AA35TLW9_GEOBA|nr:Kinesin-like protein Klp98A [Geodia barretti]